jgi:radical SAM protein
MKKRSRTSKIRPRTKAKAPRHVAPTCSTQRNPIFGDFVPLWSIASDENYLLQASDRARCGATASSQPADQDFVPPPQPQKQRTSPFDFDDRPLLAIWETTQACDLACVHCRASAQPNRDVGELSTEEAHYLIDQIAEMEIPVFVMTGGDPLKRPDIYDLVSYAASKPKLNVCLTPSATPLLTLDAVRQLKESGLHRLAISLDGATAEVHDSFRGIMGAYEHTLQAIRWANEVGLQIQINSSMTRRNLDQIEALADLLEQFKISLWSVFFLVPTGRGQIDDLPSAREFEEAFARLYTISRRVRFHIKTTEAQHYRRYVLQRKFEQDCADARRIQGGSRDESPALTPHHLRTGLTPTRPGVNDGKGFIFISHTGEVFPSGFFPLRAGHIRRQSLQHIYRDSPLLRALRDPERLKGKCRACGYKELCGGSRARAYALTGDPFAPDPCCAYDPVGSTDTIGPEASGLEASQQG